MEVATQRRTDIYSEMVDITPEYAQELLRNNNINRRVSLPQVLHYSQQMAKGDWFSETDESIKVSINRNLLDGQHRLMAIVKAGKTVKMKITYNMPDDAFRYIDQGKKRSAQDVLHIAGVKSAPMVAGIIKSHNVLQRGATSGQNNSYARAGLSHEDVFQIYQQRPEFWQDAVNKTQRWYGKFHKLLGPAFIGSHYVLFQDLHVDQAKSFFEKVCTGVGINNPKEPAKLLRDYFLRQMDLKGRKANSAQYNSAIVIKAWNLYRKNQEAGGLRWDSAKESFPVAV